MREKLVRGVTFDKTGSSNFRGCALQKPIKNSIPKTRSVECTIASKKMNNNSNENRIIKWRPDLVGLDNLRHGIMVTIVSRAFV